MEDKIMKNELKNYIIPQTEALPVGVASVLCASGDDNTISFHGNAAGDEHTTDLVW